MANKTWETKSTPRCYGIFMVFFHDDANESENFIFKQINIHASNKINVVDTQYGIFGFIVIGLNRNFLFK